jgi:CHASE2 domain-containing sensor protein/tRNA A-37 threonylcarbamoyl transferase component Bud32
MSKRNFAWTDVALGAVISLVVLLIFFMGWADVMEYKLYDMRSKLRARAKAGDTVVLIGIDDQSIREIGRWPWPRNYLAEMTDQLAEAGAKVIGIDVFMREPELNPGLQQMKVMQQAFSEKLKQKGPNALAQEFVSTIDSTAKQLDNDAKLADALSLSQNVVLPMYFDLGVPIGKVDKQLPSYLTKNFIANAKSDENVTPTKDFSAPYELFAKEAKAIGQANLTPSSDGVQRAVPLIVDFNGKLMPSFALQALRAYYNLESDDYRFVPGKEIVLGRAHIPVDQQGRLLVNYINRESMPRYYFSDVRNKKVQPEAFRDKIVLIGMMATGGGDLYVSPVSDLFPGVEIHANVINNVLAGSGSYLIRPEWATKLEVAVMLLFALFVAIAIPHLSAGKSAIVAVVLLVITVAGGIYAFTQYGYWLNMFYPALMLIAGYTVVVSKRYLVTEKRRDVLEGESAETNKMLGLSFQGQGMLDMALEKFRKVPVDDSMKEVLYNLALDFERKRQFNKSAAVLEMIVDKDSHYKDAFARMNKLKAAGETVIFGNAGLKKGADSTVLLSGSGVADLAKPTLGRYEVLRELGKGAMGTVYLGKDPKINREVAIKTLRFEDEFEPDDMKAMKDRFFREAESAGRLVHQNIVTIYDAGDDGDISYIAMELLSGSDLKDHTTKGKLLPVDQVLAIIATAAEALDYAHAQGVVHRDIKPANIMKLKDGSIKVTDFGIARITAQSKTATGTVLGTPSYMSPEQLAGDKVDGRADLFSLGVTLYEMLTGEKPFTGDSVATLMYRIANAPHPSIITLRADLPAGIEEVINTALQKTPELRYQRGNEMSAAIRAVIGRSAAAKA